MIRPLEKTFYSLLTLLAFAMHAIAGPPINDAKLGGALDVSGLTNKSAVRDALGLEIGSDIQAQDADLAAIAALATTSFGRSALTLADASAARTLFGLVIGTHVLAPSGSGAALTATRTATGAVSRTTQQRIDESAINVRELGAICGDGIDDTAAIQAAIDAAETSGSSTIYFPFLGTGIYQIDGTLDVRGPLRSTFQNMNAVSYNGQLLLVGDPGVILYKANAGAIVRHGADVALPKTVGLIVGDITYRNLGFWGPNVPTDNYYDPGLTMTSTGIDMTADGWDHVIDNCFFRELGRGIVTDDVNGCRVMNSNFWYCGTGIAAGYAFHAWTILCNEFAHCDVAIETGYRDPRFERGLTPHGDQLLLVGNVVGNTRVGVLIGGLLAKLKVLGHHDEEAAATKFQFGHDATHFSGITNQVEAGATVAGDVVIESPYFTRVNSVSVDVVTLGNPTTVRTVRRHGMSNGDSAVIAGISGTLGTAVNGTRAITWVDRHTFTVAVDSTGTSGSGGTVACNDKSDIRLIQGVRKLKAVDATSNAHANSGATVASKSANGDASGLHLEWLSAPCWRTSAGVLVNQTHYKQNGTSNIIGDEYVKNLTISNGAGSNLFMSNSGGPAVITLGTGWYLYTPTGGTPTIGNDSNTFADIEPDGAWRGNFGLEIGTATYGVTYAEGPKDLAGSGTPEGAITAPIGSTYRRTNGGAGTSFYVKESGAGNTGWVAK